MTSGRKIDPVAVGTDDASELVPVLAQLVALQYVALAADNVH